jgi:hypothetical protein
MENRTINHPLDGIRQKLIRAEEHLTTIRADIERCLEKCSVLSERDADVNSRFHFTFSFPAPDLRLSVITGECLHDLRSALDHIVWQLVLINGKTPTKDNMFPVCLTPARFISQVKKDRLCGISFKAKTAIERLQPYYAGKPDPQFHPLWVLNQLMNIDKHRTLALATIRAAHLGADIMNSDGQVIANVPTPDVLRDGAHIIVDAPGNVSEPDKVSVQFKTQLYVAFEDAPVTDLEMNSIMPGVCKFMKDSVIPSFEPFF